MGDARLDPDELAAADGRGVRVLILDSGVDTSHPALRGNGQDIGSWRVEADELGCRRVVPDGPGDAFGHGTAVAGIIRQFATASRIDAAKVFTHARGFSELVLGGLFWGIDRGYDVINCSFTTPDASYLAEYKTAVDRAFCRNVLLVAACNNTDYTRVEYPGSFTTVLSTSYGDLAGLSLRRRRGRLVEFVARGQDVRVPWLGGAFRVMSGSSFAAAHLAALAARVRQCRPAWNACQVKAALYALAETQIQADAGAKGASGPSTLNGASL